MEKRFALTVEIREAVEGLLPETDIETIINLNREMYEKAGK